ncbi:MAG: monovalent cation:proton antiporter-2 (CPA2) family protein [Myxococcota bacterium]
MHLLTEAAVFFGAAVVAVPLAKRLGLGAVLGFLAAGALIGPHGLGLIAEVESVLHFSELGVVFLLFVIGLELEPSRLWELRWRVFGLGGMQFGLTTLVLFGLWRAAGFGWQSALVLSLGLSLSSTAFALQILAERSELTAPHGRAGFGVLLFQDLVVIPILALMPLLAMGSESGMASLTSRSNLVQVAIAVVLLVGLVFAGRFLVRPLLAFTATAQMPEVSTAAALLVVVGTALAVSAAGLSMALGAFMAGVLLAESEYRHELEANIEPFKGLLLGLFFISVGMSANLSLVVTQPWVLMASVAALVTVKAIILWFICGTGQWTRSGSLGPRSRLAFAIILSQGGEFGFVIFEQAHGLGILSEATQDLFVLTVTLSMLSTPLLVRLVDMNRKEQEVHRPFDPLEGRPGRVIIAGFGRYGQIVARVLRMKRIPFTALEANASQVDFVRRYGNKIFYGDASRVELLRAAGAQDAQFFVLAVSPVEASMAVATTVRRHFPDLPIFARAEDRQHALRLMAVGAKVIHRETYHSSLATAEELLQALGLSGPDAERAVETFRKHDARVLKEQFLLRDDEKAMMSLARRANVELEHLFDQDEAEVG